MIVRIFNSRVAIKAPPHNKFPSPISIKVSISGAERKLQWHLKIILLYVSSFH